MNATKTKLVVKSRTYFFFSGRCCAVCACIRVEEEVQLEKTNKSEDKEEREYELRNDISRRENINNYNALIK